jgi:hypothetical protein
MSNGSYMPFSYIASATARDNVAIINIVGTGQYGKDVTVVSGGMGNAGDIYKGGYTTVAGNITDITLTFQSGGAYIARLYYLSDLE